MLVEFNTEEVNCLTGWFKFHCCSHFILTTFLGLAYIASDPLGLKGHKVTTSRNCMITQTM